MAECKEHGMYYPDFPGCPECSWEGLTEQRKRIEALEAENARLTKRVMALVSLLRHNVAEGMTEP